MRWRRDCVTFDTQSSQSIRSERRVRWDFRFRSSRRRKFFQDFATPGQLNSLAWMESLVRKTVQQERGHTERGQKSESERDTGSLVASSSQRRLWLRDCRVGSKVTLTLSFSLPVCSNCVHSTTLTSLPKFTTNCHSTPLTFSSI